MAKQMAPAHAYCFILAAWAALACGKIDRGRDQPTQQKSHIGERTSKSEDIDLSLNGASSWKQGGCSVLEAANGAYEIQHFPDNVFEFDDWGGLAASGEPERYCIGPTKGYVQWSSYLYVDRPFDMTFHNLGGDVSSGEHPDCQMPGAFQGLVDGSADPNMSGDDWYLEYRNLQMSGDPMVSALLGGGTRGHGYARNGLPGTNYYYRVYCAGPIVKKHPTPVCLVTLGLQDYESKYSDLNYCQNDVSDMAAAISGLAATAASDFQHINIEQDQASSPCELLSAAQDAMEQCADGAEVLFFYAGHGKSLTDSYPTSLGVVTADGDAVSLEALAARMNIDTYILDCCYAGAGLDDVSHESDIYAACGPFEGAKELKSMENGVYVHSLTACLENSMGFQDYVPSLEQVETGNVTMETMSSPLGTSLFDCHQQVARRIHETGIQTPVCKVASEDEPETGEPLDQGGDTEDQGCAEERRYLAEAEQNLAGLDNQLAQHTAKMKTILEMEEKSNALLKKILELNGTLMEAVIAKVPKEVQARLEQQSDELVAKYDQLKLDIENVPDSKKLSNERKFLADQRDSADRRVYDAERALKGCEDDPE